MFVFLKQTNVTTARSWVITPKYVFFWIHAKIVITPKNMPTVWIFSNENRNNSNVPECITKCGLWLSDVSQPGPRVPICGDVFLDVHCAPSKFGGKFLGGETRCLLAWECHPNLVSHCSLVFWEADDRSPIWVVVSIFMFFLNSHFDSCFFKWVAQPPTSNEFEQRAISCYRQRKIGLSYANVVIEDTCKIVKS